MDERAAIPAGTTFGLLGGALWLFLGGVVLVSVALEAAGAPRPGAAGVAALASASLWLWRGAMGARMDRRAGALLVAALWGLVAVAISLALSFRDVSADGVDYHLPAIDQLVRGWNPLWRPQMQSGAYADLWGTHYPKGAWHVSASLAAISGSLQAAKALNGLAALATLLLLLGAARRWEPSRIRGTLLAVAVVANPVVVTQLATSYTDGLLYLSLVTFAALLALDAKPPSLPALACLVLGLNTKFTALGYFGVLLVAWAGWRVLARGGSIRAPATLVFAAALGVVVVGANPFVFNLLAKGHPFFPLFGEGKVDILSNQMPRAFVEKGRVQQLVLGTFSESSNDFTREPVLKVPLRVGRGELRAFDGPDTRVAGFGPLWAACLLFSLPLWRPRALSQHLWLLAPLALCFASPGLWWARYVPWLYLIPLVPVAWMAEGRSKRRALAWVVLVGVLANGALVAGSNLRAQWRKTAQAQRADAR